MCSTLNSTSVSGECSYYIKELSFDETDSVSDKKSEEFILKVKILQPHAQNRSIIRSKKNIIKKHLRNSLLIPKPQSFLGFKNSEQTVSSLRDLCQNTDSPVRKNLSEKQNSYSNISSSKSFFCPSEKIISDIFDNKYTVIKKIGQGAHSTVYKCSSSIDNNLYALKKIQNVSYENWRRLKNLYMMFKLLNHRSIIGYHDYHFDQEKRTAFVVLEYCQFPQLRYQLSKKSINGKSFTPKEVLAICKQIAYVLKYLHEEGICHRDLKPQNILYNRNTGAIKIIDLDVCGVKKIKSDEFNMWTFTGTLFYRAPESFEIGYTEKVDIWGLGIIAYELATGSLPFLTEYQKDFLHEIQNTHINFKTLTKNSQLNRFIQKCLYRDPCQRPSAEEICRFLNSKIRDDSELIKTTKYEASRKRSSYTDTYMGIVCLGNLLKLTVA